MTPGSTDPSGGSASGGGPPTVSKRLADDRPASRLTLPLREFLETETAGGIILMGAVVVALVWANSPWSAAYESLWSTKLTIALGRFVVEEDLGHWINDGLMAVFFFVVGLEIKRELVVGDLSTARRASLPVAAALGGMALPAALYLAMNPSGAGARGWGIPMATDIAFALGALTLLTGVPQQLRIILLSLAIVDDVGAILVIALFYAGSINVGALAGATALVGVMFVLKRLHVWWVPLYVIVGTGVWLLTLESGVHATIAGVVLGVLAPARALRPEEMDSSPLPQTDEERASFGAAEARLTRIKVAESVPVTDRLLESLHPWSSYVILPIFALANAGVALGAGDLREAARSSVTLGVVVGLVVGKTAGIVGASWLATRLGAHLPSDLTWRHMTGLAAIAGIGFTVSLFITGLAFEDAELAEQAKVGILLGSACAAALGSVMLKAPTRRERASGD